MSLESQFRPQPMRTLNAREIRASEDWSGRLYKPAIEGVPDTELDAIYADGNILPLEQRIKALPKGLEHDNIILKLENAFYDAAEKLEEVLDQLHDRQQHDEEKRYPDEVYQRGVKLLQDRHATLKRLSDKIREHSIGE